MELFLNDKLGKIHLEINNADNPKAVLILAHGAGAGMHHSFMNEIAKRISKEDISVVRFNFPYMEQGRKSPGSPKTNIETWKLVYEHVKDTNDGLPIFVSGKSYGGRMASHLLSEAQVTDAYGIIYYGFPLHAPGRDSKDRALHLSKIQIPQLFLQGSKDKLANLDLMKEVVQTLIQAEIQVIQEADHSFNAPKKSGKSKEDILDFLAEKTKHWIDSIIEN